MIMIIAKHIMTMIKQHRTIVILAKQTYNDTNDNEIKIMMVVVSDMGHMV